MLFTQSANYYRVTITLAHTDSILIMDTDALRKLGSKTFRPTYYLHYFCNSTSFNQFLIARYTKRLLSTVKRFTVSASTIFCFTFSKIIERSTSTNQ